MTEGGREADPGTGMIGTVIGMAVGEIGKGMGGERGNARGAPAETDTMIGEVCLRLRLVLL